MTIQGTVQEPKRRLLRHEANVVLVFVAIAHSTGRWFARINRLAGGIWAKDEYESYSAEHAAEERRADLIEKLYGRPR